MNTDVFGRSTFLTITPRSFMAFEISPYCNGEKLGVATAFLYSHGGSAILVTNWHNVTGRNPETLKVIHSSGIALPDELKMRINFPEYSSDNSTFRPSYVDLSIRLYHDEDKRCPVWFEHPIHRGKVDVVVIPFGEDRFWQAPDLWPKLVILDRGETQMVVSIGSDAFILGFPKGMSGHGFPIWKRASIATEASFDIDGLPKLYVDTASREGMSGSPVFASSSGSYDLESGGSVLGPGVAQRFIGVYSGRKGDSEFEAQLGVVWKESALLDILENGVLGIPSDDHTPM